jgi:hypothetical protein
MYTLVNSTSLLTRDSTPVLRILAIRCFHHAWTFHTYPANEGGWNIGYTADPASPWLHKATDWVPAFLHYIQEGYLEAKGDISHQIRFHRTLEGLKQLLGDIRFDLARIVYYQDDMEAILIAVSEGANVVGTLAWSIVDNLEWTSGYTVKFGMQYVNFTTQERYFKASYFEHANAFKV